MQDLKPVLLHLFFLFFLSINASAQHFEGYKGYLEKRGEKYIKLDSVDGKHTLYNQDKQAVVSGTFKNNRLIDGKVYIYNSEGILDRIAIYKEGKYIGDAKVD